MSSITKDTTHIEVNFSEPLDNASKVDFWVGSNSSNYNLNTWWTGFTTNKILFALLNPIWTAETPIIYYNSSWTAGWLNDWAGNMMVTAQITPTDWIKPVLTTVTPVSTLTNDTTPDYTFYSSETWTINFSWNCSSSSTGAVSWSGNTITFNDLSSGVHNNCSITVTDFANNVSTSLSIPSFIIDATSPTVVLSTSESSPTKNIPFSVTATFSEAVTGFDVWDITVWNGTASNLQIWTWSITASWSVNTNIAWTYNLTYNYTDSSGNKAEQIIRTVIIQPYISYSSDDWWWSRGSYSNFKWNLSTVSRPFVSSNTKDKSEKTDSKNIETIKDVNIELKPSFKDIDNSFAKDYIAKLQSLNIISWKDEKWEKFDPKWVVTRSEFLRMVLKSVNKDYSNVNISNLKFTDISKGSWQEKVVSKALSEWIINWNKEKFEPNKAISRIEALKIIILASRLEIKKLDTKFADVNVDWMRKYVETAKENGIINWQLIDWKLLFRPNDSISREEVVKVLSKIIK